MFLTFILTIFATFLTRSGLIESVHTFAQELKIAYIFLAFMSFLIITAVVLLLWRKDDLVSDNQIQSYLSREAAFLFNNLMLLGAAFAVMWGTLFPLITEGLGQKMNVGPEFFNRVNIPIGLILMALTGIGPVIAWRRASKKNLTRNFALPLSIGAGVAVGFLMLGVRHGLAIWTFATAAFVLTVITIEFYKGTRARARIEGEGVVRAFVHLIDRNRRRWGGYIVHVAIVLIFVAFAGSAFDSETDATVLPGDTISVTSTFGHTYTLTYEGLSTSRGVGDWMIQWIALFSVDRDGEDLGTMTAERRWYTVNEMPSSEVGIRSTFYEDLYVILSEVPDQIGVLSGAVGQAEQASIQVQVNPLVGWIWYGAMILTIGSLIAMWPAPDNMARRNELSDGARPKEAATV